MPDVIKNDAYSSILITDINDMLTDLDETKRDINRKEGNLARMQAEEMERTVPKTAESFVAGIVKHQERRIWRGVDTPVVHNPSKASQAQVAWREKQRMEREAEAAELNARPKSPRRFTRGAAESENEEY